MKYKSTLNYVLFILLFFTLGCQTKNKKKLVEQSKKKNWEEVQTQVKSEFYNLEVRNSLNKEKEQFLHNLTDEIEYIPLETNPSILLNDIQDLKIWNNTFFILDVKKGVFQFDKKGKFVQQIGKIGNGPGEYGMVFNFEIIEESSELMLYCYPAGKVNVYDLEFGVYKRSFRISFDNSGFIEFPTGQITFFVPQSAKKATNNEIYICNIEGEIQDSISDSRLSRKSEMHAIGSPIYYQFPKHILHYMNGFQDTLYRIIDNFDRKPYLKLGLNNTIKSNELKLEKKFGEIQFPDFLSVENILENDNFIFVNIQQGYGFYVDGKAHRFIYDKASRQLTNTQHFINDIDGGLPFWPKFISNDSELIGIYQSYQIIEHIQSKKNKTIESKEFLNMANTLNENDNPVLMILKLKD